MQTWFLLHPLQGYIAEGNSFIFNVEKMIFKRRRCRGMK